MKRRAYSFIAITLAILILSGMNFVYASRKVPIKSLSMVVNKASVQVKEVVMLTVITKPMNTTEDIIWTTTDKSIATVNKYGVVTGIKPGKVIITAKASGGLNATCKITVKKNLSESDLKDLISKNVLSEKEILKLIKKNGLSKEQAMDLISEYTLSDTLIKELIKQNVFSKEDILVMIENKAESLKQYTYITSGISTGISESEAKSIYKTEMLGNWIDGMELCDETPSVFVSDSAIKVDSVKISKEHYSNKFNNRTQKYRYKLEFEGTVIDPDCTDPTFWIDYYSLSNNAPSDLRYYPIKSAYGTSDNLELVSYSMDETRHFKCVIYQYNIYCDYDTYVITSAGYGY